MNSDERAKAIIKAFKKLSVEEMEKLLIKLGIPTDRKLQEKKNMKSVYCKHCGTFLFGIESDCKYYVTKCKKCGVINRGSTSQVFKPKKKNEK